jgi:hypothetical protein
LSRGFREQIESKSNVISIPREFEALGYGEGSSVIVEEMPGGDLRIMSTENVVSASTTSGSALSPRSNCQELWMRR